MQSYTELLYHNPKSTQSLYEDRPSIYPTQEVNNVSLGKINVPAHQAYTSIKYNLFNNLQAVQNYQNILNGGGSIDIYLRPNNVNGPIKQCFLSFSVTPSVDCSVLPAPQWLNFIELLLPSGQRAQIMYGTEQLYFDRIITANGWEWRAVSRLYLSDEEYISVGPRGQLKAGVTYDIKISLETLLLSAGAILYAGMKGESIFRCWFNNSANFLVSGQPTFVMTNLIIECYTEYRLFSDYQNLMDRYVNNDLYFKYTNCVRYPYPITGTVASQTYNILLSPFNGYFSDITFYIKLVGQGANLLQNFQPIESFQLLESNGTNILVQSQDADDILYSQFAMRYHTDLTDFLRLYQYDFSDNASSDWQNGVSTGGYINCPKAF